MPFFSIITVCYNSEKTIEKTLQSVLSQTEQDFEYILIDGASTDGTLDILRAWEPKFGGRMKIVSEPDAGIYDAMNKGIRMARGTLVGIVNSDDFYHPNDEGGLAWNDPEIGIVWPGLIGNYNGTAATEGYTMADGTPLNLSEKDQKWLGLKETFRF